MAFDFDGMAARAHEERGYAEGAVRRSKYTKSRSLRLDDELWLAFKARCADRGETMTTVLERLMRGYLDGKFDV